MMYSFTGLALLAVAALPSVLGHGVVTTPTPRQYASIAKSACGSAVYSVLTSDLTGPIENAVKKVDSSFDAEGCELYFCRGARIEDNVSNTRKYVAGDVVNFQIDLVAHHTGYANVSIVDLTTKTPIGAPIFDWPVYANQTLGPWDWPANETNFDVTIPDLQGRCAVQGACAIQWFWFATVNSQTYESCVDFTQ